MSDANHTAQASLFAKPTGTAGRTVTKHGHSYTSEYRVWQTMRLRCHDPKHAAYANYGGRGITVCDRWLNSLENFLADMGPKPTPEHEIDRIDNDKGYCKENCRWVTRKENSRNRRSNRMLEYLGETKTLTEWCEQFDIPRDTVSKRLDAEWSVADALTTPARIKAENGTRDYHPRTQKYASEAAIEVLHEIGNTSFRTGDESILHAIAEKLGWPAEGPKTSRRVRKALQKRPGELVKTLVERRGKGSQVAIMFSLPTNSVPPPVVAAIVRANCGERREAGVA